MLSNFDKVPSEINDVPYIFDDAPPENNEVLSENDDAAYKFDGVPLYIESVSS